MLPLGVLVLDFDPLLHFGDAEVRLETVAIGAVLAVALVLAGLIARVTPVKLGGSMYQRIHRVHLRPDDLLFVAMGALPGAVVGGRIGYVLLHLDYYALNQDAIVDPAQGSMELTLAVVGGCLTAAYVLRLLGAPLGRWAHVATFPLLLALGAGKLAQVLGGDGQGLPTDAAWATLYRGDGPWGSLIPEITAHPSQLYEGFAALLVLQLMTIAAARGAFPKADGSALLVGIAAWSLMRAAVASTWRDAPVLGPLLAEQVIALTVALGCVLIAVARGRRQRRVVEADAASEAAREAAAMAARRTGSRAAQARPQGRSPV